MKILQLCKKFPHPHRDGETITIANITRALHKQGCDITLLTMNIRRQYIDLNTLPADFNYYSAVHVVDVDNSIRAVDAFFNLFTGKSYHMQRFENKAYDDKLIELLKNNHYDVVLLETLFVAPYIDTIRKYSKAKIVQRSFNVEFDIWERITNGTPFGPKKWYLRLLTNRLRKYEIAQLNRYDLMVGITPRDLEIFRQLGCTIPGCVAPIGINMDPYTDEPINMPTDPEEMSFSFIGGLDWVPNIEGVEWLLKEVWDKMLEKHPKATLHVAGRATPDWLKNGSWKGVVIHGEVPDAIEFIRKHPAMLVPLFAGGGMRTKIVQAMALQRVVITTAIGLEGIDSDPFKNVLMAETVEDFLQQMDYCIKNPQKAVEISKNARQLVIDQFSNETVARNLKRDMQKLLDADKKK